MMQFADQVHTCLRLFISVPVLTVVVVCTHRTMPRHCNNSFSLIINIKIVRQKMASPPP